MPRFLRKTGAMDIVNGTKTDSKSGNVQIHLANLLANLLVAYQW